MYAGIDFSMSCPGISLWDPEDGVFCFNNCQHFYLTSTKKYVGRFNGNCWGDFHQEFNSDEERFVNIRNWYTAVLKGVNHVWLEGYSMGSKGKIFNIAENTGLLKNWLHENDIKFETPAPTAIKKFAAGS